MIHWIYLVSILAYAILFIGFAFRNVIILLFASLLMFPLSVYTFVNGMDIWNNFVTTAFSAVTLGIAAYVGICSGVEMMETL